MSSRAPAAGPARRCVDVHLHVGYDRAAEGRRADPPQRDVGLRGGRGAGVRAAEETTYLFLPLAHAFALIMQLAVLRPRDHTRLLRRDTKQILAELVRDPADLPPVGAADLREDLHAARADGGAGPPRSRSALSRRSSSASRCASGGSAARRSPTSCSKPFEQADEQALLAREGAVRRARAPGGYGRRADRARDPRVLLRLRGYRCSRAGA